MLGQNKGVCRDDQVGGIDSFQIFTFTRENGINTITFRRTLKSNDDGDKEFRLDAAMYTVCINKQFIIFSSLTLHVYPSLGVGDGQIRFK